MQLINTPVQMGTLNTQAGQLVQTQNQLYKQILQHVTQACNFINSTPSTTPQEIASAFIGTLQQTPTAALFFANLQALIACLSAGSTAPLPSGIALPAFTANADNSVTIASSAITASSASGATNPAPAITATPAA